MRCYRCRRDWARAETIEGYCGPQCPDCLVFLEPAPKYFELWSFLYDAGLIVAAGLALALVCMLLSGCGAPFTAGQALELEQGGTSTTSGGAGAGGAPSLGGSAGALAIAGSGGRQGVSGSSGSSASGDAGAGGVAIACELAGAATAFASWTSGDGGPPSSAVDGNAGTRWTSGVAQAPGQWFQVDLSAPLELERLVMTSSRATDLPASVALRIDGVIVPATLTTSPGSLELEFAPHRASAVRLELEQPSTAWWSISELAAVCP